MIHYNSDNRANQQRLPWKHCCGSLKQPDFLIPLIHSSLCLLNIYFKKQTALILLWVLATKPVWQQRLHNVAHLKGPKAFTNCCYDLEICVLNPTSWLLERLFSPPCPDPVSSGPHQRGPGWSKQSHPAAAIGSSLQAQRNAALHLRGLIERSTRALCPFSLSVVILAGLRGSYGGLSAIFRAEEEPANRYALQRPHLLSQRPAQGMLLLLLGVWV